jgi:hypothetical protein
MFMIAKVGLRPPAKMAKSKTLPSAKVLLGRQGGVIFYGVLFLMGVALGAAVVSWLDAGTADNLLTILGGFVSQRRQQSPTATFFSALGPNLGALCILLASGFCAISAPVIFMVPCFKGMGFGLMAAAMFVRYGMSATRYLTVLVMPNLIWSTVVLLFCCRDAMQMSLSFWNVMKPQQRGGILVRPGRFCARVMVYALLLAAGAAVEANLFGLFGVALALS